MARALQSATKVTASTVNDQATSTILAAVQGSGTHTGTPSADFSLPYNGILFNVRSGVPFIADAALYAFINANTSSLVTWAN